MAIELNHTIVPAHDPKRQRNSSGGILGLPIDPPGGHFTPITLANHVTLDYDQHDHFDSHHYAFLVGDEEFEPPSPACGTPACPSSPTPGPAGGPDLPQPRPPGHVLPRPQRPSHGDPHPGRLTAVGVKGVASGVTGLGEVGN